MKNISKKDAERMIEDFFLDIKNKNSRFSQARSGQTKSLAKQVKKIKSLAMNKKILLKEKRKLFETVRETLYKRGEEKCLTGQKTISQFHMRMKSKSSGF